MKKVYACVACWLLLLTSCSSASKMLVKSDPPGADIYINGEKVGKTPAALKVSFPENCQRVVEKKILSVKLAGYKEKKEVISPENSGNKTFEFTLAPEVSEIAASPAASKPSIKAAQESDTAAVISGPSITTMQEGISTAGEESRPMEKTESEIKSDADGEKNIVAPPAMREHEPVAAADALMPERKAVP